VLLVLVTQALCSFKLYFSTRECNFAGIVFQVVDLMVGRIRCLAESSGDACTFGIRNCICYLRNCW